MHARNSIHVFVAAAAVGILAGVSGTAARAGTDVAVPLPSASLADPAHTSVRVVSYRSHTGRTRLAYVLLPSWYGPARHPAIPLVISPHGRGTSGRANTRLWGDLPGIGSFAVVNPDGEGDHLDAYSWGAPGEIEDLARMPAVLEAALPLLRIDHRRLFAVGGSMGGQETLLLLARNPSLLAGAAAFDSLVDFSHQYGQFQRLHCNAHCRSILGESLGSKLQRFARIEVGGDPAGAPAGYASRSPLSYARAIAFSCVPLQLWWSSQDRIVVDPQRQTGALLAAVRRLNPSAPVEGIEGTWAHSAEMRAQTRLPFALAGLGLLPPTFAGNWGVAGARVTPPPAAGCVST